MIRLLKVYLDICLLRKGPQDLPFSQALALLSLLAYFAASNFYLRVVEGDPRLAIEWALISTGLLSVTVAALLTARRRLMRFRQTLSAFAGTGALLTLLLLPISNAIVTSQAADNAVAAPIALAWLGLFIWSFVLDAHIYRHALSVSFTAGMLITALLFALSRWLFSQLGGVG